MSLEIKKYDWVDALRGYAILLVMMIHTSQLFIETSFINLISRNGDLGVTMFFIVSSFTLFNSYKNRLLIDGENTNKFFFIRRFFRIAPIYYIAIVFYILVGVFYHSKWIPPLDTIKIISNFLFLNGLYLPAINYIPPGGWSVGAEMFFYLTIPFLFSKIRNTRNAFMFLLSAITISFVIQIILYFFISNFTTYSWIELRGWEFYFWFPNQFPVFCFGILLFYIINSNKIRYKEWMLFVSIALIMFLNIINYQLNFPEFLIQREYLFSISFCMFAFSLSKTKYKILITPLKKLGQVSFSAYLIHFIVIDICWKLFKRFLSLENINADYQFILMFILVVINTFIISKLTYRFIEKKGISVGEDLIEKNKISKLELVN